MRLWMDGLEDLSMKLLRMGDKSRGVSKAMLIAAAEKTKSAWRIAIERHGLIDTGDMLESVGYRAPSANASSVEIYPQGTDRKGVRNAEKAFILHYGTSDKKHPATRFVDDAYKDAEAEAIPIMQDILGEFMQTGRVPTVVRTPNRPGGANGKN